jgi:carbon monoxide dehydrogenase subunit G
MKIEGEYVFDGPREQVWEIVRDPEVLATALPGTQSLEQVSESEYKGQMYVRIGPVSGAFAGTIIVSDEVPPESCTLLVDGRGAPGFAKGSGHIHLTEQDDGTTMMRYDGDVQIGGRLASAGQRLLDTASRSLIREGLVSLNSALVARTEAVEEGREVEYTPSSETKFALAVAQDMVREMLPPPTTSAILLAVAGVFLAIGFWLGRKGRE